MKFSFSKPILSLNTAHILLIAGLIALYAFQIIDEQKTVSVAVDKMNVFYIGVDNPITVAVEGVANEKVVVKCSDNIRLRPMVDGRYVVTANRLGDAKIMVSGEGFEAREMTFRVKRIPQPRSALQLAGNQFQMDGTLKPDQLKTSEGLAMLMDGFDFDANIGIRGFTMVRVPKSGDPSEVVCQSAKFDGNTRKIIDQAAFGDTFYFEDIRYRTLGDCQMQNINSLVFRIE